MAVYEEQTKGVISLRLFETSECQAIVQKLMHLETWNQALIREERNGHDYSDVKNPALRSATLAQSDDVAWLYREFELRIHQLIKPVVSDLWKIDLKAQSGTQLLKYEVGDHYKPHLDTGVDLEQRYFSVLCYLNDDFQGGRTLFPTLDYAVTPVAGQAVLFPSMYRHGSEPITSGRKFVLVSWIDGPVAIKWI